jgi:hypothetical protein
LEPCYGDQPRVRVRVIWFSLIGSTPPPWLLRTATLSSPKNAEALASRRRLILQIILYVVSVWEATFHDKIPAVWSNRETAPLSRNSSTRRPLMFVGSRALVNIYHRSPPSPPPFTQPANTLRFERYRPQIMGKDSLEDSPPWSVAGGKMNMIAFNPPLVSRFYSVVVITRDSDQRPISRNPGSNPGRTSFSFGTENPEGTCPLPLG